MAMKKKKARNKRVSNKIKKIMGEGKSQKQAVAQALNMERRGKLKGATFE